MTAVKLVVVEVGTPAPAVSFRFGPQNQANAAALWFEDVTANFWADVTQLFLMADGRAGWALDGTHKVVAVKNTAGVPTPGSLLVVGTK